MKAGVVIFPGSNCDEDLIQVLEGLGAGKVSRLWHQNADLDGCTHIFLPGGFSYGDYLRSGAIAKLSPVMGAVKQHASNGGFVLGICNGFQILCETNLLPGALLRNTDMRFSCKNIFLRPVNTKTQLTHGLSQSDVLKVPIAHGEGRFYCDEDTLKEIESHNQVIFRYCDEEGNTTAASNPNGSLDNIAGISNKTLNVFGMMPHPERCALPHLFNEDGKKIFDAILGLQAVS
jgi:phosphoribosylformylglycinamidine synthase I